MTRETSLVTTQWVEEHAHDDNVVLIEVDEDTTAYDKGHIAGAIKLDWTTDLQDQVRRDFVNKRQFEELLSERGIANDDTVVLYGGNNNWFAAYAYWYFTLYGHADVKLMDGGRKKWELDSRPLTDEVPSREKTSYTATEQDRSIRAFRDDTVAAIGTLLTLVAFTAPLATINPTALTLGSDPAGRTWILSSMSIGLGAALLTTGTIADDVGRRRTFVIGNVVLAADVLGARDPLAVRYALAKMREGEVETSWRNGAVEEIVEEGVSGFVVDSHDQAVEAVKRLPELDRRRVREAFMARFTARRMAQDYVQLYRRLLAGDDVREAG